VSDIVAERTPPYGDDVVDLRITCEGIPAVNVDTVQSLLFAVAGVGTYADPGHGHAHLVLREAEDGQTEAVCGKVWTPTVFGTVKMRDGLPGKPPCPYCEALASWMFTRGLAREEIRPVADDQPLAEPA